MNTTFRAVPEYPRGASGAAARCLRPKATLDRPGIPCSQASGPRLRHANGPLEEKLWYLLGKYLAGAIAAAHAHADPIYKGGSQPRRIGAQGCTMRRLAKWLAEEVRYHLARTGGTRHPDAYAIVRATLAELEREVRRNQPRRAVPGSTGARSVHLHGHGLATKPKKKSASR